jgi:hypothetical protein
MSTIIAISSSSTLAGRRKLGTFVRIRPPAVAFFSKMVTW